MEMTTTHVEDMSVIAVKGKLDTSMSGQLQATLLAIIDQGTSRVAVDCTQLDYISSAGLRIVVLLAAKQLRATHRTLVLYAMTDQVKAAFDMAGFSTILPIVPSQADALVQFTGQRSFPS